MRWLLWKDYRHNRLIVYTALVLLFAPHLVAIYAACKAYLVGLPDLSHWREYFYSSILLSFLISQVAVALIGGNAFAGERLDRSAEFLFSLPIARTKLLASKLLLALGIAAAPWLVNLLILCCVGREPPSGFTEPGDERVYGAFTGTAITVTTIFGVAWFVSSFIGSPAYAACLGLLTPLIVLLAIESAPVLLDLRIPIESGRWYRGICLTLGPPLFALGTWHYLRRVEP